MREHKLNSEVGNSSEYKNVAVWKDNGDKMSKYRIRKQARKGRFKISEWDFRRTIAPTKDKKDFIPEETQEYSRVCLQYSKFNRTYKKWVNQTIWLKPEEIHDLHQVLDDFDTIPEPEIKKDLPVVTIRQDKPEVSEFWKKHNRVVVR